jgi:predicted PurR-regulated permease PerM
MIPAAARSCATEGGERAVADTDDKKAEDQPEPIESSEYGRQARLTRGLLIILALITAFLLWAALDLLLVLFIGVLGAIFLRTLTDALASRTRLSDRVALPIVVLGLLGIVVVGGWFFAGQLVREARAMKETIPKAAGELVDRVDETEWGSWLLDQVRDTVENNGTDGGSAIQQTQVMQHATTALNAVIEGATALVIVMAVSIFLAAAPDRYIRGILRMVPIRRRERIGEVIYAAGYTLRWWLVGQVFSMLVVGIIWGTGLAIIGVPLAFGLGVLAGLFEFIPTIGPMLGLLPALLLAVVESPQMALYVLGLYAVLQTIEGNVLTPLVQQRVVHLPPVLTISAQVFFAWRLGPIGLIVAVPLVAIVVVVVQMLYVKDVLTDRFELTAEREGRRELEEAGHLKSLQ